MAGKRRPGLIARLQADFLAGLAVVLPAGLTVMLLVWAVGLIDRRVVPLVPVKLPFLQVAGAGVLVFLLVTIATGAVLRNMIGQRLVLTAEGLVTRVPVARQLYLGVKQLVSSGIAKGGGSFRQACLVEYPERGTWSLGFVTAEAEGEVRARLGKDDLVAVLVPKTPNPINGFMIFVSRQEIMPLDIGFEEAAKLVISAGLVGPPGYRPQV